jgi:predicted dehydrogenase
MPFLEAGVPVYIDKPFTASVEDARKLIAAAQKAKVGFGSFSNLRYADNTKAFVAALPDRVGVPTAGVSAGSADENSEYDGLIFYGIHCVELVHEVFGYGCRTVRAVRHQNGVTSMCGFADGPIVTVNFLDNVRVHHVTVYGNTGGKPGWHAENLGDGTAYPNCMRAYLHMMRSGEWPYTPEQLLEPIQIFAAIDRSLKENREVRLDEV